MPDTREDAYAARLQRIQLAPWKAGLRRFDPYGTYLRSLRPGRTLEIGCGIGRNLAFLAPNVVGIDHNPTSVQTCRARGLPAYEPGQLDPKVANFDTLLLSHVLEHMRLPDAADLIREYLPRLKPAGRVVIITPQERGQSGDPTT
jgi:SAM-dependent methyltransferase